jgi:tetratricopeptide (TPR) repeat protein
VRYRAFISYSHADARWAAWLHRALETYRVPRRLRGSAGAHGPLPERLGAVFRDREELASAGELGPQIQAALGDSEALIVVCSPEAARSRWVDAEVRAFRAGGHSDRVYALIVAGEPNSGDERECFPPALRGVPFGPGDAPLPPLEPIAADLRPGKDGKSLALMKLLSGLLGVSLDALRQRETQRRHQRMLAITSLAVAVMLVTSFLAVQAIAARKAAERRQQQAEALVAFMLGDLNDKLAEVSRLDILSSVHDQAMTYFRSLPDTDVTDAALAQRSKALLKIGNVRIEQGALDKALDAYQAALVLSGRLAKAAPADLERQLAHADVLAFIGTANWYRGDLEKAQQGFDAAQDVLVPARALAPDDARVLYQLATIDNNVGHVLESRGRMEEAATHYRRMLELSQRLVALEPGNVEWQNELALSHNNLAKMALLDGRLADAVAGYRAALEVEAALATLDARNNAQAERLLIARATLGRTLALTGALDEGADTMEAALAEARRLHAVDASSVSFQEDVGLYAMQLARLRRLQGHTAAATARIEESLAMLRKLTAQDPSQPGWQRELAEAQVEHAAQLAGAGNREAARTALAPALDTLDAQVRAAPQERNVVLAQATATLLAAALADDAGARTARAQSTLAQIRAQTSGRRDPRLRALEAEALLLAGDAAAAAPVLAALAASGYRDAALAAIARSTTTGRK